MELSYPIFVAEIDAGKTTFNSLISGFSESVGLDAIELRGLIRQQRRHLIDLVDEVCFINVHPMVLHDQILSMWAYYGLSCIC